MQRQAIHGVVDGTTSAGRLEPQRKSPDEVVSLIKDVEGAITAKIERRTIVFVFPKESHSIGQEKPYSGQGIKP